MSCCTVPNVLQHPAFEVSLKIQMTGGEVEVVDLTCFLIMTICKATSVLALELLVTIFFPPAPEIKLILLNFSVKRKGL